MQGSAKRLRFPYAPAPEESLLGALAAACHDSRVRNVEAVMKGAGMTKRSPLELRSLSEEDADRLADAMRCDRGKVRVLRTAVMTKGAERIAFGALRLPRPALELRRRRIAPSSLLADPRHRHAWLLKLLPYCPRSLELLVDQCPDCGPLGWRRARGIGACDGCGESIRPSEAHPLCGGIGEDYRLFAGLASSDPETVARSTSLLPPAFHGFGADALFRTSIRAGLVEAGDVPPGGDLAALGLPPERAAHVAARGIALFRRWPDTFRSAVEARERSAGDDLDAYDRIRKDVRWIAAAAGEASSAIVAMAFPSFERRIVDTLSAGERYYTTTQARRRLSASTEDLARLRDADAIGHRLLPSLARVRARYDADDVDGTRRLLDRAIAPEAFAFSHDMPTYAAGQLVADGHLEAIGDKAVRTLRGVQLTSASVDDLIGRLTARASLGSPPVGARALARIMPAFGGEKPWSRMVTALLDGEITFHLLGSQVSARTIALLPEDVLSVPPSRPGEDPLGFDRLSMLAATEILSSSWSTTTAALAGAGLEARFDGQRKIVERHLLAALSETVATMWQVRVWNGWTTRLAEAHIKGASIPRLHGLLSRVSLTDAGLLPGST